jgi:HEAT repeat protein
MSERIRGSREVVEALCVVGLPVSSVWDLVNSKESYPQAIPVLLKCLQMEMDPRVKEGVVRALTVREARTIAAKPLVQEFLKVSEPDSSLKWAIGNALAVVADDSVFEEIAGLVSDSTNGRSRQMLVEALGRMKNPRAVDLAISLLDEEEVAGHAIVALRKLRAKRARPFIEPFLKHPMPWIRNEANRTLAAFDKPV